MIYLNNSKGSAYKQLIGIARVVLNNTDTEIQLIVFY